VNGNNAATPERADIAPFQQPFELLGHVGWFLLGW